MSLCIFANLHCVKPALLYYCRWVSQISKTLSFSIGTCTSRHCLPCASTAARAFANSLMVKYSPVTSLCVLYLLLACLNGVSYECQPAQCRKRMFQWLHLVVKINGAGEIWAAAFRDKKKKKHTKKLFLQNKNDTTLFAMMDYSSGLTGMSIKDIWFEFQREWAQMKTM